jgi:hypothetical protein
MICACEPVKGPPAETFITGMTKLSKESNNIKPTRLNVSHLSRLIICPGDENSHSGEKFISANQGCETVLI